MPNANQAVQASAQASRTGCSQQLFGKLQCNELSGEDVTKRLFSSRPSLFSRERTSNLLPTVKQAHKRPLLTAEASENRIHPVQQDCLAGLPRQSSSTLPCTGPVMTYIAEAFTAAKVEATRWCPPAVLARSTNPAPDRPCRFGGVGNQPMKSSANSARARLGVASCPN